MVKKKKKKVKKKAKGKRKIPPAGWPVVTGTKAAAVFGVNIRSLQRYIKEGMPTAGKDKYDLGQIHRWLLGRARRELEELSAEKRRIERATAEQVEERAALLRMRRRKLEGKLLEAEEVERERVNRIIAVTAGLEYLPVALGRQVIGLKKIDEIEEIIEREVNELRRRFADDEEMEEALRERVRKIKKQKLKSKNTD